MDNHIFRKLPIVLSNIRRYTERKTAVAYENMFILRISEERLHNKYECYNNNIRQITNEIESNHYSLHNFACAVVIHYLNTNQLLDIGNLNDVKNRFGLFTDFVLKANSIFSKENMTYQYSILYEILKDTKFTLDELLFSKNDKTNIFSPMIQLYIDGILDITLLVKMNKYFSPNMKIINKFESKHKKIANISCMLNAISNDL